MSYIIDVLDEDSGYEQYVSIEIDYRNDSSYNDINRQYQLDHYEKMIEYSMNHPKEFNRSMYVLSPLYIIIQFLAYWFLNP